jgi:formimidoylglutamate deiminase
MSNAGLEMPPGTTVWHIADALLPAGWAQNVRISVIDGRIVAVDPDLPVEAGDIQIGIGLPAMGNLHSHSFQRAMAGLTEVAGRGGDSFWSWRHLMYRFVDAISPDALEAIAAFVFMEMIESGFTRVGEFHYLHHDTDGRTYADPAEMAVRLIAAAEETGMALTLLPVFYAHAGFGGRPAEAAQRRFLSSPDSYARLIEGSRAAAAGTAGAIVGIAPHSLRATTPEELAAVLPLAAKMPVHIHIAEQVREVEDCIAWSGARPVRWLLDHAPVDARWCLVHATHIEPSEITDLARSGAVAGLCPITEANLGDGIFPAQAFADAGGTFGVGTDSNVRIDMTEELRLLEYGQRLSLRARNIMGAANRSTGRCLFDRCVVGGARALGVAGGLAVGTSADLIALQKNGPAALERSGDAVLDTLLFSAGKDAIADVWRAGRRLVIDGRHQHREAIERRYCSLMNGLLRQ